MNLHNKGNFWRIRTSLTFFPKRFLLSKVNPSTVMRQDPILERYSTLSATTKPTVKNTFDAGRNGTATKARPMVKILKQKHVTWFIQPSHHFFQGIFKDFSRQLSSIQGLVVLRIIWQRAGGHTKYRILNTPLTVGLRNLKGFSWLVGYKSMHSRTRQQNARTVGKNSLTFQREYLNYLLSRTFHESDNLSRTFQGLCEPCVSKVVVKNCASERWSSQVFREALHTRCVITFETKQNVGSYLCAGSETFKGKWDKYGVSLDVVSDTRNISWASKLRLSKVFQKSQRMMDSRWLKVSTF